MIILGLQFLYCLSVYIIHFIIVIIAPQYRTKPLSLRQYKKFRDQGLPFVIKQELRRQSGKLTNLINLLDVLGMPMNIHITINKDYCLFLNALNSTNIKWFSLDYVDFMHI